MEERLRLLPRGAIRALIRLMVSIIRQEIEAILSANSASSLISHGEPKLTITERGDEPIDSIRLNLHSILEPRQFRRRFRLAIEGGASLFVRAASGDRAE